MVEESKHDEKFIPHICSADDERASDCSATRAAAALALLLGKWVMRSRTSLPVTLWYYASFACLSLRRQTLMQKQER